MTKKLDAITDELVERFKEEGIESCSFHVHYSGTPLVYTVQLEGCAPLYYGETHRPEVKPTVVTLIRLDSENFFKNNSPIVLKFKDTDEYDVFAVTSETFISGMALTCHHCKLPGTHDSFAIISTKLFCENCKALFESMPQKLVAISAALEYRLLEEGVYLSVDDIEIFSFDIHDNPVVYDIKLGGRCLSYRETEKVKAKPDVVLLERLDDLEYFFKNMSQIVLTFDYRDGKCVVVPVSSEEEKDFFHTECDELTNLV